jgi:hypothetical protein
MKAGEWAFAGMGAGDEGVEPLDLVREPVLRTRKSSAR